MCLHRLWIFNYRCRRVPDVVIEVSYRPGSAKESVPKSPNDKTSVFPSLWSSNTSCGRFCSKNDRHFVCMLLICSFVMDQKIKG